MTRNATWWGPLTALLALACSGGSLSGCGSAPCEENDSCGGYPWSDACDGAGCAEASIPDVVLDGGTDRAADVGTDSERDVSVDAVVDADVDAAKPDNNDGDAGRDVGGDADADAVRDVIADVVADADAEAGPTCDVTKSPVDEPCLIDDRYGVFVSASGNDTTGMGTKASPYKTVTKGLASAQGAQSKNVYVCAATYAEAVTVDAAVDGSRLFGGFDCVGWAYAASNRPVVKPPSGTALVVKALTKGLRIEDVEFDAPPTTTSGESSVAAWITGSANVRLVRVKLVAAPAQAGANGVSASNYDATLPQTDAKIAGKNATGATGGAAQTCAMLCANSLHATGGKGGNGGPGATGDAGVDAGGDAGAPSGGENGGPLITPENPAGATGAGGVPGTLGCSNGVRGSDAPARSGGNGAPQPGNLTTTGWTPASGNNGTSGDPGQGGGGGSGAQSATMGGGGGGGCGGCGGAAGPGGQSGGSSFALLSYQSAVTLDACELVAAAGGNGGKGADGQAGQPGGLAGVQSTPGCPGGAGGTGGTAGGGGGGAGGHSVAIGHAGLAPIQMNGTTLQVASQPTVAGAAGSGGSPVATPGVAGKAQNVMELP